MLECNPPCYMMLQAMLAFGAWVQRDYLASIELQFKAGSVLQDIYVQPHGMGFVFALHYGHGRTCIASLFMVSFYCFVTKACAERPDAAASVERRRRERRTLLAWAAGELAGATRLGQARASSACTFSADHK